MKKYTIIFSSFIVSALLLLACGSEKGGDGGTVINCPAGTVFQNGYCVQQTNGAIVNTGSVGFYSENWHDRTFTPVGSGLREFLKNAMGVCDRAHINGALADCSAWTAGAFDIVLQSPSTQTNTVQVTFRAKPALNPHVNYAYALPSPGQMVGAFFGFPVVGNPSAVRNPLQVNMTVSVINNSQGFEARGYGDFYTNANRSPIQIRVAQGKLDDPAFDYYLSFRGQDIATGRFLRCNNADCGLSRPFGY